MEVKEIKEKKTKLEKGIELLINDFNEETGCPITDFSLEKYATFGGSKPTIKVILTVEI